MKNMIIAAPKGTKEIDGLAEYGPLTSNDYNLQIARFLNHSKFIVFRIKQ